MPPLRTFPTSKPMKTERTHEENQERAYIAASRRSDRSLEARVESARRASEIHKRRTGRSLRVTEQDVINEEMYEEEDDDLPMGYRRLTAHLQTGSADFNRRLTAYLTSHVAMRSALDQAIHPYAYPTSPGQIGHHVRPPQSNLFPSPLMTQGLGVSPRQATTTSPRTPHPYRQTPYPMPGTPGFRPQQQLHNRSSSISVPQPHSASPQSYGMTSIEESNSNSARRMSMPASSVGQDELPRNVSSLDLRPDLSRQLSASSQHGHSAISESGEPSSATSMGPPTQSYFDPNQQHGYGPLTMNLPQESKQLLAPALNTSDPFASMLMGGSSIQTPGYYNYGSSDPVQKPVTDDALFQGIDTSLASGALAVNDETEDAAQVSSEVPPQSFADLQEFGFPASQNSSNGEKSTSGADASWEAFIDDKSWTENAT